MFTKTKIIYETFILALIKTVDDDGVEHAGYMSFMFILSIFPFVVFFLLFTQAFGASELGNYFVSIMIDNMPKDAMMSFRNRLEELMQSPPQSVVTIAVLGNIWTSSSFVEGMRTILNRVYEIKSPPPYILRRLLSIAQFFMISAFMALITLIVIVTSMLTEQFPFVGSIVNLYFYRLPLIFCSLVLTTILLYHSIPNVRLSIFDVVPGAVVTVFGWVAIGNIWSRFITYYTQISVIYGSLASIILTLLFFYIVSMIFIYGAEFNYILGRKLYKK